MNSCEVGERAAELDMIGWYLEFFFRVDGMIVDVVRAEGRGKRFRLGNGSPRLKVSGIQSKIIRE